MLRSLSWLAPALGGIVGVALVGGCRENFDATPDAASQPDSGAPLPALVCSTRSFTIPSVSAATDLSVTNDGTQGYAAAWIDPVSGKVEVRRFDRDRTVTASTSFLAEGATLLAGLEVRSERVWLVVGANQTQTLWSLSPNLSAATKVATEASVFGSDPIAVGLGDLPPIWIRGLVGTDFGISSSYLTNDGTVGVSATRVTSRAVTSLSVTDYDDHVHLAWRESDGRCLGSDVDFEAAPRVVSSNLISADCAELRIVSGPPPHDPLVAAWTDAAGAVRIKYSGGSIPSGGTEFLVQVGSGRAPRITFDGEAYWMAWRDGATVQLARIDASGNVSRSSFTMPSPLGDGAFELVRRGITADLVMLTGETLTFFALCPQ